MGGGKGEEEQTLVISELLPDENFDWLKIWYVSKLWPYRTLYIVSSPYLLHVWPYNQKCVFIFIFYSLCFGILNVSNVPNVKIQFSMCVCVTGQWDRGLKKGSKLWGLWHSHCPITQHILNGIFDIRDIRDGKAQTINKCTCEIIWGSTSIGQNATN